MRNVPLPSFLHVTIWLYEMISTMNWAPQKFQTGDSSFLEHLYHLNHVDVQTFQLSLAWADFFRPCLSQLPFFKKNKKKDFLLLDSNFVDHLYYLNHIDVQIFKLSLAWPDIFRTYFPDELFLNFIYS